MKLITTILLFITLSASAQKAYYVSPSGNDANSGTNASAPWQTLSKVNSATYTAGDSILFIRGGQWYGSIIVSRNNLYYGAYGSGAAPVITGLTTLTSWVPTGSGKYYTSLTTDTLLNLLLLTGEMQTIARRPNADSTNEGFLTYRSVGSSATQIRGTVAGNHNGRKIVCNAELWSFEKLWVTADNNDTFTVAPYFQLGNGSTIGLNKKRDNSGYFFIDDTAFLDRTGEWKYQHDLNRLYIWLPSAPSNYTIQVATVDTLMNIGSRSNTKVEGLSFTGGNLYGIFVNNAMNVDVVNCTFNNFGVQAIGIQRGYAGTEILNNTISNCHQTGIYVRNSGVGFGGITISGNTVSRIGRVPGMGSYYQSGDHSGIYVFSTDGATITNNKVDDVSKNGIMPQGNNLNVSYNEVRFPNRYLDDGGGIYSWSGEANFYNRRFVGNYVQGYSTPITTRAARTPERVGIYIDDTSGHVVVDSNVVINMPDAAFQCNCDSNIQYRNNIVVLSDSAGHSTATGFKLQQKGTNIIRNFTIQDNILYLQQPGQKYFSFAGGPLSRSGTALQDALKAIGTYPSEFSNTVGVYRVIGTKWVTPQWVDEFFDYTRPSFTTYSGFIASHTVLPTGTPQVVYNATASPLTHTFTGLRTNGRGQSVNGSVTIPPYSGELLINTGAVSGGIPVQGYIFKTN